MSEKYLRVRSGMLQTPIVGFNHQRSESTISLVGMMHVGRQEYYDQIMNHVQRRENRGSIVHYEMVQPAKKSSEEAIDEDVLEAQAGLSSGMGVLLGAIKKYLGAVDQKEAMNFPYPSHWENHDTTMDDFSGNMGSEQMELLISQLEAIKDVEEKMGPESFGRMIRTTFRFMPLISRLSDKFNLQGPNFKEKIIDNRNAIAVRAVERCIADNPNQDITMLWGSAHIPGIKLGLENLGYRKSSEQWLGAVSLRKFAIES